MKFEELKQLLLSQHPALVCEQKDKEFVIINKTKAGEFVISYGASEEAAFRAAAAFYKV